MRFLKPLTWTSDEKPLGFFVCLFVFTLRNYLNFTHLLGGAGVRHCSVSAQSFKFTISIVEKLENNSSDNKKKFR